MKYKQFLRNVGKLVVAGTLCGVFSVSGQTLGLNLGSATTTINKALYGTLMENYGRCIYNGVFVGTGSAIPNTNGMRNDVIAGFQEAGVGCIEFPGGCFADSYHWQDGTASPQSSRPGGEMANGLGTPEFFKLCSLSTALPYPTANIQSGTSSEMNAWLTYIHDRANYWNILKHWKIGNEEWSPCGNMTQASYQTKFDQWYVAEPSWATSTLMHIMDGGSGGGWVNADATYAAGKSGPMGISYHYYAVTNWSAMGPSSGFTVAQYYAQLQRAWAIDGNINGFSIPSTVALCVDEWGAWYDAVSGQGTSFNWSTVRDAIIAGMSLNVFNNRCARVKMALVAQPVNVIQALMLTNSSNQSQMRKTPVFWVFKMYKPHQNATMVPVTWTNNPTNQSIPQLNASASVDASNVLHISVVNTHDANSQALTINLNNSPRTYTTVTGQMVNGASITSGITSFTATDTASLQTFTNFSLAGTTITTTLPAHSVVMLTVSPQVGVSAPDPIRSADEFSIKTAAGGRIAVNYPATHKTPVRLSLYGIDGRTLVETYNGAIEAGQKTLVWQPKNCNIGTNVYIVKLEAGEVTTSERLVITR